MTVRLLNYSVLNPREQSIHIVCAGDPRAKDHGRAHQCAGEANDHLAGAASKSCLQSCAAGRDAQVLVKELHHYTLHMSPTRIGLHWQAKLLASPDANAAAVRAGVPAQCALLSQHMACLSKLGAPTAVQAAVADVLIKPPNAVLGAEVQVLKAKAKAKAEAKAKAASKAKAKPKAKAKASPRRKSRGACKPGIMCAQWGAFLKATGTSQNLQRCRPKRAETF